MTNNMMVAYPEVFSGASITCGSFYDTLDNFRLFQKKMEVPEKVAQLKDMMAKGLIGDLSKVKDVPMIFVGEKDDWVIPNEDVKQSSEVFKSFGANVDFILTEGEHAYFSTYRKSPVGFDNTKEAWKKLYGKGLKDAVP